MKIDSTVDLALIVAFASVVVPAITSWIGNRFKLKIKKLELKRELYTTEYVSTSKAFQEFISNSGIVLAKIDISDKPNPLEINKFETSCLKCFLYLDESERQSFRNFQIAIKSELGYPDPRPMFPLFKIINNMTLGFYRGNELHRSFNRCISISNEKLQKLRKDQLQLFDTTTILIRILRRIPWLSQLKNK